MQPFIIDVEAVAIEDVDTYLEPVAAPSNYKDAEKIAAYQAEKRAELTERAALDVDLGRIIAIGISRPDYPTEVWTTQHRTEHDLLEQLWEIWTRQDNPRLVTFNGLGYDVPLLLRRSLYLGVPAPYIQCDRFKHPQVIDLMATLSMDGKLKFHGLQFYLNRFGYQGIEPDITGAEIAKAYAEGDWPSIERHCYLDVAGTKWLAERIGAIPKGSYSARRWRSDEAVE
jgi:hypothetical protein